MSDAREILIRKQAQHDASALQFIAPEVLPRRVIMLVLRQASDDIEAYAGALWEASEVARPVIAAMRAQSVAGRGPATERRSVFLTVTDAIMRGRYMDAYTALRGMELTEPHERHLHEMVKALAITEAARKPTDARAVFETAGFDFESLTLIPAKVVDSSIGDMEAYLDEDALLLMFVDTAGPKIKTFMFYAREEGNQNVVGVGRNIAAFKISEHRVYDLLDRVARGRT